MSTPRLRISRCAAVIAVVVAVEFASAGFAIGVAAAVPGLTTVATASVDGATGTWASAQFNAAAPAAIVVSETATTPPGPTPDQSVVPTAPSKSRTARASRNQQLVPDKGESACASTGKSCPGS